MYNVKGLDLAYRTGYVNGYTQYATKSLGQLEVEYDAVMYCAIQDKSGDNWYIGMLDGIEYAMYLKRMKLPLTWREELVRKLWLEDNNEKEVIS